MKKLIHKQFTNKKEEKDLINTLPAEIQQLIFADVKTPEELTTLSQVCKKWQNEISANSILWKKFGFVSQSAFCAFKKNIPSVLKAWENKNPQIYILGDAKALRLQLMQLQSNEPDWYDIQLKNKLQLRGVTFKNKNLFLVLPEQHVLPLEKLNNHCLLWVAIQDFSEIEKFSQDFAAKAQKFSYFFVIEAQNIHHTPLPNNVLVLNEKDSLETLIDKTIEKLKQFAPEPAPSHKHAKCMVM